MKTILFAIVLILVCGTLCFAQGSVGSRVSGGSVGTSTMAQPQWQFVYAQPQVVSESVLVQSAGCVGSAVALQSQLVAVPIVQRRRPVAAAWQQHRINRLCVACNRVRRLESQVQ